MNEIRRQKQFRDLAMSVFRKLRSKEEYDASELPVDCAEHGKLRDVLVLKSEERVIGRPLIEKVKNDRVFVESLHELGEECVLPLIQYPRDLITVVEDTPCLDETLARLTG